MYKLPPLLLSVAVLALFFFFSSSILRTKPETKRKHIHITNHLQIAHSTCEGTLYPQLCVSTLASLPDLATKSVPQLISATVNRTVSELKVTTTNCTDIKHSHRDLQSRDKIALNDCLELLNDSITELKSALSDLSPKKSPAKHYHDLQTLFSAAMTNEYTCLDGFAYSNGDVRGVLKQSMYNISRHVSNSLVMLKKIPGVSNESDHGFKMKRGFPTWVSSKDRKLLQTAVNETKFDLIVAKDGSGNFTTVSEAVEAAPNSSTTRFVIYIKAGAYFENVEVVKKKTLLTFIGDGIGKTVIKANRNVVDGWTTFRSATLAVVGNGFIAKGITIENSAGPSKHQAVALRSGSDLSAFYKCSFVGYQDTLYVHSLRQFYRECDIYGTVDFVFGNAAAVFQNCNLYARKPNEHQKNMFTAQGREDPNQNTGISIINCKFAAAADLIPNQTEFKTYLGRPWKEYSRTVIMKSYISDVVQPAGWLEWNETFALSTLYYGEYMNRGPGANTSGRVTWPGYRVINSSSEASQFTVESFLQGSEWLNGTGIPYSPNLD